MPTCSGPPYRHRMCRAICLCLMLATAACAGRPVPPRDVPSTAGPRQGAMLRIDPKLPQAVVVDGLRLQVAQMVPGGLLYSRFGARGSAGGGGGYHRGIDISAPRGTPIRAAAAGEVVEMGHSGAYGRLLRIRHSPHVETVYAHLSAFAPQLAVGRAVAAGEVIGHVGMSGRATGPHLHFEVRRNREPIDPLAQPVAAQDS